MAVRELARLEATSANRPARVTRASEPGRSPPANAEKIRKAPLPEYVRRHGNPRGRRPLPTCTGW